MAKFPFIFAVCVLLFAPSFSAQPESPRFGNRVDRGLVEHEAITEASGLVASRKNPDVLWTHNDHGNPNCLYALSTHGKHIGVYCLGGIQNRDWEDLALGPGPVDGQDYLYIGEIGDNKARYDFKYMYRVPEPTVASNQDPLETTLSGVETLTFRYPDGNRDAETLLVDPLTTDLFVVSKRERTVHVYRASYPQSTTQTMTLEQVTTLSLSEDVSVGGWTVGGDVSPSGREILIKTYMHVYYWHRTPEQKLWEALTQDPVRVPYIPEPQGEAVGWSADGSGYYTVSEEDNDIPARLYFYPRLASSPRPPGETATHMHEVEK